MTTINNINNTNNINSRNIIIKSNAINGNNINILESRDIIKTISATINGTTLDIQIKYNKNIYLQEIKSETKHKFKQIFINGVTNEFIYIRIKDEIIENMLSITDWVYPKLDQLYINNTFFYIYLKILLMPLSIYLHANDEPIYHQIKNNLKNNQFEIKYSNIFICYGDFEKIVSELRFYLYLVSLIILFAFMIKRAFYGGKNIPYLVCISYILVIILNILNFIFSNLTIILLVFSFLVLNAKENYVKVYKEKFDIELDVSNLDTTLIFHILIGFYFLLDFYKIFACSCCLLGYVSKIKNYNDYNNNKANNDELNNTNNTNTNNNNKLSNDLDMGMLRYRGLDGSIHTLYEYQISGHPRYLYYSFKSQNNANNNKENNKDIDIGNNEPLNILIRKKSNNGDGELVNSKNLLDDENKQK